MWQASPLCVENRRLDTPVARTTSRPSRASVCLLDDHGHPGAHVPDRGPRSARNENLVLVVCPRRGPRVAYSTARETELRATSFLLGFSGRHRLHGVRPLPHHLVRRRSEGEGAHQAAARPRHDQARVQVGRGPEDRAVRLGSRSGDGRGTAAPRTTASIIGAMLVSGGACRDRPSALVRSCVRTTPPWAVTVGGVSAAAGQHDPRCSAKRWSGRRHDGVGLRADRVLAHDSFNNCCRR